MANIKLKDASGNEVSYNDIDKIIVPSTSGGTTEFLAGGGTISIAENGNYDVTRYAEAEVNVSGGGEAVTLNLMDRGPEFDVEAMVIMTPTGIQVINYPDPGSYTVLNHSIIYYAGDSQHYTGLNLLYYSSSAKAFEIVSNAEIYVG